MFIVQEGHDEAAAGGPQIVVAIFLALLLLGLEAGQNFLGFELSAGDAKAAYRSLWRAVGDEGQLLHIRIRIDAHAAQRGLKGLQIIGQHAILQRHAAG